MSTQTQSSDTLYTFDRTFTTRQSLAEAYKFLAKIRFLARPSRGDGIEGLKQRLDAIWGLAIHVETRAEATASDILGIRFSEADGEVAVTDASDRINRLLDLADSEDGETYAALRRRMAGIETAAAQVENALIRLDEACRGRENATR